LSSKTTLFWASKRRRFGHFIIIFLKKKKKRKKKKENIKKKGGGERNRGWLEPPPRPVWGWSNHPHGQGGGPATPKSPKKKTKNGFWPFGGGRTTPKDLGVDSATPKGRFGVDESTPRSLGVAPQILIVLFLIYLFDNIIQLISLRSLWYYGGW
jgi:hypothetical protein